MRKKNGFTLVELLSTIVILGIICSITVFLVMKNINKAKDDTEIITYNNIKSAARVYNDEVSSYWNTQDDYEYSCVSLGNMIELGLFDENTINSNDKLSKDTKIKVIRDKDSKVIKETSFSFEDSILPDVDCGYQANVSISADNNGKKVQEANAKIVYTLLNGDYSRYFQLSGFSDNATTSDVVYACEGIGNCSNDTVNSLESGHWYLASSDVIRFNIKSNGVISAYISYNGENVADATKNIDFIDRTPPVINLSVSKIGSYEGNNPKTKGDFITTISSDYGDSEWKNYGYWFDISTNEDSVIKWSYNDTNKTNGDSPSKNGANCNTTCSKTLSGDGNRKATITATDEAGNSSKIEINIYIDRTAPTINVSEQRCSDKNNCLGSLIGNKIEKSTNTSTNIDDKTWTYNGINISYNATDSMSGFKEIRVLQNNSDIYDSLSTDMISNDIVNNNGNTIVSDTGQRYIQVIAYDNVGNSSVVNITGYISSDITPPICTLSANSSTITATASDDKGIAYQGWSNSYSGSNSTSKDIAEGEHIYYVKDTAGNTSTCSIDIKKTTSYQKQVQNETSAYEKWTKSASGVCRCRGKSTGSGYSVVEGTCTTSGCSCPSGTWVNTNNCTVSSSFSGYYCTSGTLSGSKCITTSYQTAYTCGTDYTKIDNNWCYKK